MPDFLLIEMEKAFLAGFTCSFQEANTEKADPAIQQIHFNKRKAEIVQLTNQLAMKMKQSASYKNERPKYEA